MVDTGTYTSSNEMLRFPVTRSDDGDVTLGFDGFPWHTHADLLVGWCGPSEEAAVHRFLGDLLHNRLVIAVVRRDRKIVDIRVTDDPKSALQWARADETLEFRYWVGSPSDGSFATR